MKKFIYSLFVLAIAAMTFSGCEDVPAPYNLPQEIIDGGDGETTADPMGTGTETDPYNVAAANQVGATLSAGESTETVYIRGIVSRIDEIDPSFGNATYCISDDGTPNNQFLVYRGYSLGGEKFTSVDELKVGDEVIVKGTITNYNGTIELNQRNEIYSLNGVIAGGETGEGDGTEANPYSASQALDLIKSEQFDADAKYYVKGIISQIDKFDDRYSSITYYISDDGTTANQLQIYSGKSFNGEGFSSIDDLKVGDEVVLVGEFKLFNGTPEVNMNSELVSLNGETSSGEAGDSNISISDNMLTLTNSAVTAGTETATLNVADITGLKKGDKPSSLTMSDGSVITFDANGETNAPAYHETDMRVYKNNIMHFSCKKTIAKIVITCSADDRVGNKTATVSFNGNEAEYNNVFTEDKGGGVQLRITNIVVTYAK